MSPTTSIILPVENQVRELDSKLLIACVAAERGLEAILGNKTHIDFRIARLPRGVYISKSMTIKSEKVFRTLRLLGHDIAVWDEEALVYQSPEMYHARRMCAESLEHVSLLFAWGSDNEDMFRKSPDYSGTPIRVVGNPRIDLLRPELRCFFDAEVERIRQEFGRYVLINTNFSMVNGFLDGQNLFVTSKDGSVELGGASRGMTREFAKSYAALKGALFDAFRSLLPALGAAFPDRTFVLRPHPSERPDPWHEAAQGVANVRVALEGNVIPWLLGADALIHNGCTTAIEATVLRVPAVCYQPVEDPPYDFELPNALSRVGKTVDEVVEVLRSLPGARGARLANTEAEQTLSEYMVGLTGALASERIVDVLATSDLVSPHRPPLGDWMRGWYRATQRSWIKQQIKGRTPGHPNTPEFQQYRFPGVSQEELRARIRRLSQALGRFEHVGVRPITSCIFRIAC